MASGLSFEAAQARQAELLALTAVKTPIITATWNRMVRTLDGYFYPSYQYETPKQKLRNELQDLSARITSEQLQVQAAAEAERHRRASSVGEVVEGFLRTPAVTRQEGEFSREELAGFATRNREGFPRHFSSFNQDIPYPYAFRRGPLTPEEIVDKFVHVLNPEVSGVEGLRACMEDGNLAGKALQVSAFLKLLGDENRVIANEAAAQLVSQNLGFALDPIPRTFGKIAVMLSKPGEHMGFMVTNDIVDLCALEEFEKAERTPVAQFRTRRNFLVFPPDDQGNVAYVINRSFEKSLKKLS